MTIRIRTRADRQVFTNRAVQTLNLSRWLWLPKMD